MENSLLKNAGNTPLKESEKMLSFSLTIYSYSLRS
jgi:hypothetical protein